MTEGYRTFHGKILLFGEYTIITGSKALVIPFKHYSGNLAYPDAFDLNNPDILASRQSLYAFFEYLSDLQGNSSIDPKNETRAGFEEPGFIDIEKLGRELERGLFFRSSIPLEYGVGSSAALVAALYDAFAPGKINYLTKSPAELTLLKNIFIGLESYFHGTSSGIDPLCCYTGATIIQENESIYTTVIPGLPDGHKLFVIDSGGKGETAPLVEGFKKRLINDSAFMHFIEGEMTELVNYCIQSLSTGALPEFTTSLNKLSGMQLESFISMIPDSIRYIWEEGIQQGIFTLKLCGSGGGGFFLGYTEDWEKTTGYFERTGRNTLALDL